MAIRQLQPLQVNPKTGEPFLRLPGLLEHIIITPIRETDKPAIIRHLNDQRVIRWLSGPPYPYLQEHADYWVGENKGLCDATIRELEEEGAKNPEGPLKLVEHCPVRIIREVKPDGEEVFLGDCDIHRCLLDELDGEPMEENASKPLGDPSIIWTVGDYLAPSHHGQGIMSAVFATLLNSWAIPRCNAHILQVYTYASNGASVRVFEKNGFQVVRTVEDWKEVKGVKHGLKVLQWRRPSDNI